MRLFVAVEVGADVRNRAAELADALRDRVRLHAPRARLTWVLPEQFHVTIRFLGEVPNDQVRAIEDTLSEPLDLAAFSLRVRGVAVFPPRGAPRAVWLALAEGERDLAGLARAVDLRLALAGLPSEQRAFHPHLTLARVRDARGLRPEHLTDGFSNTTAGTLRVDRIRLIESRLGPAGPDYRTRIVTPLRPAS